MANGDTQLSVTDFASRIKTKYPEYKDIPDDELSKKIVAKYPEYRGKVKFGVIAPPEKQAAATPPISPIDKSVVKPMDPSPLHEAVVGAQQKFSNIPAVKKFDESVSKVSSKIPAPMKEGMQMGVGAAMGTAPAAEDVAVSMLDKIASEAKGARAMMPAASAAQGFRDVHMAAKDLPVDTSKALKLARIAASDEEFGGSPPKVITAFLTRMENPEPLTYADARKFFMNANELSSEEAGLAKATMRRHMTRFARALNEGIENTTETVGHLDTYKKAVRDWKIAKRLSGTADFIKKHGIKTAIGGLGLGAAGYGAYKELSK